MGSYGNVFNIRALEYNKDSNPVIRSIVQAWEKFYEKFVTTNENFREGYIFENPAYKLNNDTTSYLRANTLGIEFFREFKEAVVLLKFSDLVNSSHNIPFLARHTILLRGLVRTALASMGRDVALAQVSQCISSFMGRSGKGSKRFRAVICKTPAPEITHNIKKNSQKTLNSFVI